MKKILVLFVLICISHSTYAQKEDYIWVGGKDQTPNEPGIVGFEIDFNLEAPTYKTREIGYGFGSYNGSICDKDGNLLFYTNGCAILNPDGTIMTKGDSLNYNEWFEVWRGGDCNKGYTGVQDVLILPNPSNESEFFLIGKIRIYNGFSELDSFGLHTSKILLNGPQGNEVLSKNEPLYEYQNLPSSYLSAVPMKGDNGYFIVIPKVNDSTLLTYKLDNEGFSRLDDQNLSSYFSKNKSSATGTAKFSPDGNKFAFYNYYQGLHIYDFDRGNGTISNHQEVVVFDSINLDDSRFGSVEWSSNGRYIYTASRDELHQIDTWEEDLQEGIRLIDVYNGTLDPGPTPFFLMSLAPDCRIYIVPTNGTASYHIINKPNELGAACDFVQNGVKLPQWSSVASLPNFPRWRVDEEDKCDSTIVSVFGEYVYYRSDLDVYPNPSSGVYNVSIPKIGTGILYVTSINGEMLYSQETTGQQILEVIDITTFPSGIYNIEYYPISNAHRKVYTKQVIKSN